MIYFSKHNRSTQEELMDDFSLQGEPLQEVLKDLDTVNRYLGGNQITIDGLEKMLLGCDKNRVVTIVDYGCGDGGSMALCAAYLEKHHWRYKLIGLDANAYIIEQAKTKAHSLKHSTFKVCNVFDKEKLPEADIALCTLFLHHFKEAQIIELLNAIATKTQVGIVINDLQRSRTAFRLFQLLNVISRIFQKK
jgi:2-polyprenyl-3-methyl-5-hydroxy-6-metoxy-1,4-benzoquinol methylase